MAVNITYDSFEGIDAALGITGDGIYPHTDLNVDAKLCRGGSSKLTQTYWDNLSVEDKKERLSHLKGRVLSEETKSKIRMGHLNKEKTSLHKGGTLIKDGELFTFSCLSHFCKEHGLSTGHVCELLKGKRKSVKGWKLWAH